MKRVTGIGGVLMDPEGNRIEMWEPGVPFAKESNEKVDA